MTPSHVFLDMDGVLADFVGGVERLFGRAPGSLKQRDGYDLSELLGVTPDELHFEIVNTPQFWEGLSPLPWAIQLLAQFPRERLFIASSPWADPDCYAAKVRWAKRFTTVSMDRVVLTPHKHLMAAPGRLLIDDHPRNVELWVKAGGHGVLWPAEHNGLLVPDVDPLLLFRHNLKTMGIQL